MAEHEYALTCADCTAPYILRRDEAAWFLARGFVSRGAVLSAVRCGGCGGDRQTDSHGERRPPDDRLRGPAVLQMG